MRSVQSPLILISTPCLCMQLHGSCAACSLSSKRSDFSLKPPHCVVQSPPSKTVLGEHDMMSMQSISRRICTDPHLKGMVIWTALGQPHAAYTLWARPLVLKRIVRACRGCWRCSLRAGRWIGYLARLQGLRTICAWITGSGYLCTSGLGNVRLPITCMQASTVSRRRPERIQCKTAVQGQKAPEPKPSFNRTGTSLLWYRQVLALLYLYISLWVLRPRCVNILEA